ncbi:zinc finger protein 804B [Microcaecilia unicolor]|uniref:Zinc finger protein 804B n=1 Tax=Microcaecilia unicolor TaxID=1415580 RepID=A0A6P7XZL4_9AMPH|nr:zinc finger protein 804B [Microcaecilia unicolor]
MCGNKGIEKRSTSRVIEGYSGKEKAIANALEDLKANFYCELCDKQYHKHQEFDNHINSYDHAHKQRLKELKQREFARNVASKSWKDEKKQEKALKRLYQLAELRKQSECASRSDPLFKALRTAIEKCPQEEMITYKDSRCTAGTKYALLREGENLSNRLSVKQQELSQSIDPLHVQSCPLPSNPIARPSSGSHRAGVSFCFSKKALLKLESSASVFHENTEETNDCCKPHHPKASQPVESIRPLAYIGDDSEEGKGKTDSTEADIPPATTQMLKESKVDNKGTEAIGSDQVLNSVEIDGSEVDLASSAKETEKGKECNRAEKWKECNRAEKSSQADVSNQRQVNNLFTQQNSNQHSDNVLIDQLTEFSLRKTTDQENASELNFNHNVVKIEKTLETSNIVFGSKETDTSNPLINDTNPETSFLHVLSKDGNTSLQWPTELLLFTKTQPTISYGCNPLYFDFKLFKTRKTTKRDEVNTENNEELLKTESMIKNENSSLLRDINMPIKKDKIKCPLKELPQEKCESNKNNIETKESRLETSKYLNENAPKQILYPEDQQNVVVIQNCSEAQKQKISLKRHLDDHENIVLRGINARNSIFCLNNKAKKLRTSKCGLINLETKYETQECCKSPLKEYDHNNGISDDENDAHDNYVSDKSSSYSRSPDCENNESSIQDCRYSSSGWHSTYSDTSVVSTTSSYTNAFSDHNSSHQNTRNHTSFFCERKYNAMEGLNIRQNYTLSSDDEHGHFFHTSQRVKDNIKTQKHKISRKNSKQSSHHRCTSKQSKNGQPHYCRKYKDRRESDFLERSHSKPVSSSGCSGYRRSGCSSSGSFSKAKVHFLHKINRERNIGTNSTMGKEEPLHDNIHNTALHSKNYDRLYINSLENNTVEEKISSIEDSLLEKAQSNKQEEKVNTPEGKKYSESFYNIKLPPSARGPKIIPLQETVSLVNERSIKNNEADTIENGVNKNRVGESQKYELNVTTSTDCNNSFLKDIIQIETECHCGGAEIQKAAEGPLISQVQPFIQSCDPIPTDFHGAFQSKNYSVSTNSVDTKEEQRRLTEENMSSCQSEGNSDHCYDRSMQSYVDEDHELQDHNKSVSPLAPQTITFSPDEVDKYRILQMQAQQHMQKQFFSKHLKVVPATAPAAFSTTSTFQPVPIQHHASITTIHHSFLQHYTHPAPVHHRNSHFPLTHIYPHSHSHFIPISLSALTPTIIPTHPAFLTGYPIHLLSATAIHPSQLTMQPFPHTAFIPTLIAPHLGTGVASSIHLHPIIHPMFHGQDFHHHSGFGHSHS